MQQRNITFDTMKGIGILLVIVGHLNLIPRDPYRRIIFSFHMPLFLILSGYFCRVKPLKSLFISDLKRLVVPYVLTSIIIMIWGGLVAIVHKDVHPFLSELVKAGYCSGSRHHSMYLSEVPSIGAIWFLMALFWCRFVYNILSIKYLKHKYLIGGGISVVATLIDYYVINLPFAILPGLSAIMFYALGDFLRSNKDSLSE